MDNLFATILEDDRIIVVAKPSGMFVHRADGWDRFRKPLLQRVRDRIRQRVFPVHRLDRATSGLVLLAKDRETAQLLAGQFRERRVCKIYAALVRGFCEHRDVITIPLPRRGLANDRPGDAPTDAPRPCRTEYQSLERYEIPQSSGRYLTTRCSLLNVTPTTGRWHQIRRHLNRINHPLIGDTTHGDNTQNRFFRQNFALQRLMLAAIELTFMHPHRGEVVTVRCPPDETFQSVIDLIRPWTIPFTESTDL